MRIGFPFFPIGSYSLLTKLLAPLDAVVYLADIPFFLGEPFESSLLLSRLLFLFVNVLESAYVLVLAELGIERLTFTSVTADTTLLGVSF